MFEYMLDYPRLDGSTIREVLQGEKLSERDFLFVKELILGCPVGRQHASVDPTVSACDLRTSPHSSSRVGVRVQRER